MPNQSTQTDNSIPMLMEANDNLRATLQAVRERLYADIGVNTNQPEEDTDEREPELTHEEDNLVRVVYDNSDDEESNEDESDEDSEEEESEEDEESDENEELESEDDEEDGIVITTTTRTINTRTATIITTITKTVIHKK